VNQYKSEHLSDELKTELDKGISDIEQGKYLSHQDAMEIIKKQNPKYF
jgi:predicted transcriptional regulator